jgi:sec-independent protein translocase protein TatA
MPLGLGHWWILLILAAIALIIFGPQRLPELGQGLGKAIREFRKGASEMTESLKEEATKPTDGKEATDAPKPTVDASADGAANGAAKPTPPTEAPKA